MSIPDLLSLLHQHKKSGLLSLVSRQDERGILFHKGNLVYATASGGALRLGNFLVRLGYLSDRDLAKFSSSREAVFLGQDLVARGVIKEEELQSAVRTQILEILDEALLWEEGAFHFDERGHGGLDHLPLGPVIPTQSILLDAIRRFDESQMVRASFPNLSVVLKASDRPPESAGGTEIDAPSRELLSLVDGKRSIGQILRESPHSPFETATHLTTLSKEGHIQALSAWPAVEDLTSTAGDSPLPVAPDLPGRIYWILRQSGKNLDQIAEVISQEPTLAAKALRHFAAARLDPIRGDLSVAQIIEGLGELRARAFVIPELIRGVFFAEKDFFWKGCRKHSVFCAQLCRELAALTGYPRPEEAYLAGLLHNLGVYVLIGVNPARYRLILGEARRTGADLCTLEKDAFGMSHVKVGMTCAQRWHFPTPIAEAVWLHHEAQDGTASPLVDLVTLANWVAIQRQVGPEYCSPSADFIDGPLDRFKLKKKQIINWAESSARVSQAIG